MSKLGTHSFIQMTGEVGLFGTTVQSDARPGRDDMIRRDIGRRGTPFQMTAFETFDSLESAKAGKIDYINMKGSYLALEYCNESYTNVFIENVTFSGIKQILAATNGHTYMIQSTWTLQLTE